VVADFKKRYADYCIDESTIYCYDLSNPASYPTQGNSVANTSAVNNLVSGGTNSVVTASLNYAGGGLDFSASTGQRIELPDEAKLGSGFEDLLWGHCFKHGTQSQSTFEMGGYHYGDTGPYGLRSSSAGTLVGICSGVTQNISVSSGSIYFIHIALEKVDVSTYLAHFFKNGVLVASKTVTSPLQQPSTAVSKAALMDAAGTTYTGYWVGRFYRSWLTTKHRTYAQILELVQADYALNLGYMS